MRSIASWISHPQWWSSIGPGGVQLRPSRLTVRAVTVSSESCVVSSVRTNFLFNLWLDLAPKRKSNKGALLQQLILEEVIIRREANILAFQRGMAILSDLIRRYPALMRPLLVAEECVLTSDLFMSLIGSLKPSEPTELLSFERFVDLVVYIGGRFVFANVLVRDPSRAKAVFGH